MHSRTSKRVFSMIFLVWFASVIVSLAPQFGWKDPEYLQRIEQQKCMVSQDVGYQVSLFFLFPVFSFFSFDEKSINDIFVFSGFRNMLYILCSIVSYISFILENISNS